MTHLLIECVSARVLEHSLLRVCVTLLPTNTTQALWWWDSIQQCMRASNEYAKSWPTISPIGRPLLIDEFLGFASARRRRRRFSRNRFAHGGKFMPEVITFNRLLRLCGNVQHLTQSDAETTHIYKQTWLCSSYSRVRFGVLLNASAFEENAIRRGVVVGDGDSPRIC